MKNKKKVKREWKSEKTGSESSGNEADQELDLTDYAGNSIKLMTEIFKILGDKKLKQMVPSILNPIDINDLKASLVEESMALSKKRVISILNGENYTTSSESEDEEEKKNSKPSENKDLDVISLDGISDDSDIFCFDDLPEAEVLPEVKKENKKDKKKHKKPHKPIVEKPLSVAEEKAMTALELLELQARARAIKSQLALESVTSPMDNVDDEIKNEPEPKETPPIDIEPIKSTTKKVKLRRNHLRIDPRRTASKPIENAVESGTSQETEVKKEKNEIKKERRSSTDSLIVESPSHPLIVLTSSEDEEERSPTVDRTQFTNTEEILINTDPLVMEKTAYDNESTKKSSRISDVRSQSSKNNADIDAGTEWKQSNKNGEECLDLISDYEKQKNSDNSENDGTSKEKVPKNGNSNETELEEASKNIENEQSERVQIKKNTSKVESGEKQKKPAKSVLKSKKKKKSKESDKKKNTPEIIREKENKSEEFQQIEKELNNVIPPSESGKEIEENTKTQLEKKPNENIEDCIIIDSEPEFDSEPENTSTKQHDENDTTWKQRWLDSKKVKSVLQTSKLCNNMKRKLKKDPSVESEVIEEGEVEEDVPKMNLEIEGSITHFNMLSKNSPQL